MLHLQYEIFSSRFRVTNTGTVTGSEVQNAITPHHLENHHFQFINTCAWCFGLNTSVPMEKIQVLNGNFTF